ncbi:MAG: DNA-processing protein DprA [Acidimicrobiia bacterium]
MSDGLLRLAFGGLSPNRVDTLMNRWQTPEAAVTAIRCGSAKASESVRDAVSVSADQRRNQLARRRIDFLDGPESFPSRLAASSTAPRWLFAKGSPRTGPSIAIVGTRTCTAYGTDLASAYGMVAAAEGWTVVSGLAKGIDHAAQSGAVESNGHCVSVLGSGIDVIYPRQHAHLHDRILDTGGAVVSEFPPGTRPDGWRFPTRNRIIVGLADVVLVVEAGETGGALITARIALEAGTPVYATPADVDRPASVGTNRLIRDGAFPVFGADDLRMVLSLVTPLVSLPPT